MCFLWRGGTDEHWLTEPVIVDLVDKYIQIKNSINIICSFTKKTMMQCGINPLRHLKKAFQLNTSTTATTLHSKKKNKQTHKREAARSEMSFRISM